MRALIQYTKHSTYWSTDPKVAEQVEKIVLRESKRNNVAYRQHASECLANFVELRTNVDLYSQTHAIVAPIIEEALDNSEEMDVDSKSGGPSSKSVLESTLANSARALLNAINPSTTDMKELSSRLAQSLKLINRIKDEHRSRKAIDAIYEGERFLFEKIDKAQQGSLQNHLEDVLIDYSKQVFSFADQVEMTRIKAAEVVVALAPVARRAKKLKDVFVEGVAAVKQEERSATVQQILDRARKVVDE